MKSALTKTMIAALATSVALGALPVFAQDAPPPAPEAGMVQAAPPAPPAPGPGPMDMVSGPFPRFDLKSFDADGDGKVTLAEIEAKRAATAKAMDTDGDGLLSAEELVAAEMVQIEDRVAARVKDRIAAQDSDGDGKLSAAELASPPLPTRIFDRLDRDNDGAVSTEELRMAEARMKDRFDRGGDDRRDRHDWRGDRDRDDRRWFNFGQ
ncbi:EF hand domain-containing protein [Rhodobacter aestuarii]|uniref:EF hand n=1 Tax=Rhodobacter aestuarii TaxID=453582 RepID=A0A1N7MMJ4_9RHOB|nr:EF-hand domain-containing protein [Rhodobacter aestuarii]PTV96658.1 EF hand domain-containing protein [Rhodobacter aestuarii]SIS87307.1 EF hand [Rhodobacter aestuarii]